MILAAGVIFACFFQLALWRLAWQDRHVPAYVTVVPALALLAGARRAFAWIDALEPMPLLGDELVRASTIGPIWTMLGVGSVAVGLWPRVRGPGHGAPALVQTGAVMVAVGLVWRVGLLGQARLWRAAGAPLSELHHLQHEVVQAAGGRAWLAVAVLVVGWLTSSIWGWRRHRRRGLGEGLGAAALVALVLGMGRPALNAMARVNTPLRSVCASLETAGVSLPAGTALPLSDAVGRWGDAGLERWSGRAWEPWDGQGAHRLLWVAPADQTVAQLRQHLAKLPPHTEVLLAGLSAAEPSAELAFQQHPVLMSARCRAWPLPHSAEASHTIAQSLPLLR